MIDPAAPLVVWHLIVGVLIGMMLGYILPRIVDAWMDLRRRDHGDQ